MEEVRRVCFAVAQDRCRTVRQRMQLLLCLGDELQELIGEGREEELIPARPGATPTVPSVTGGWPLCPAPLRRNSRRSWTP